MHGKSTLATALVQGGGRLVSDDTVPVVRGDGVRLRPGLHQVRLWRDAALHLVRDRASEATQTRKVVVDHMPAGEVERSAVTFAAAYVLVPAPAADTTPASRTALSQVQGTLALIEHAKLGPLLGGADAALVFEQAAAIAREVPIYLLRVARDLDRLTDAANVIGSWHTD
jgi:hypothetical protein